MASGSGRLRAELQGVLPAGVILAHCVPVSHVPLTEDGRVDEQALEAVPVIDADLTDRWQQRWRTAPGVDEVAVVVEGQLEPEAAALRPADSSGQPAPAADAARVEHAGRQSGVPAISHGGPLREEPDAPTLLSEILHRAARQHPDHAIVCIQSDGTEVVLTYPALLEQSQRIVAGLRAAGLRPGAPVIFQLERAPDFLTAFWACMLGGFVPVPVPIAPGYREPNPPLLKLQHACTLLGRPLVLADASRASAVRALSDVLDIEPLWVEAVEELARNAPDTRVHPGTPADVALMLLTSGSTGKPKAVMQSHRSLLGHCAGSTQLNGFTSRDVSLNWLPLDHVGAIMMVHVCQVYLACGQVHAPTELVLKAPLCWLDWMDRYRATIAWAPNFAFSMITDHAEAIGRGRWDLSSMRFIINGGEAIVARTARRFLELLAPHGLPATAIRPAWGMSETSSGATYADRFTRASSSDDDGFVCVGAPLPGFSVRIVDAHDQVLTEGAVGRLQVRGLQVTSGYYGNAEHTGAAFTADGWFTTGDLGRLDDGRLTITGREKDVIIINGVNYYSHEIEAAAEEVEGVDVSYVAACAVRQAGSATDQVAIFFSATVPAERQPELARHVRVAVLRKTGVNPHHLIPVRREDIPKTSIGKIQRAELRQRFERGDFAAALTGARDAVVPPTLVHRRCWRRRDAGVAGWETGRGRPLILLDDAGLGARVCAALESIGVRAVRVEVGAGFSRLGPDAYRLDPGCAQDFDRLLADVADQGIALEQVVHLAGCPVAPRSFAALEELERALEHVTFGPLFLVQALARRGATSSRLLVVSRHAQAVNDEAVAVETGALLGLLRTAAQELPWLSCRHLDLPAQISDADVDCILREMQAGHPDREVAYRGGHRYVPRLQRVAMLPDRASPPVLKRGGMYLLTGGLGGVSAEIADHLLSRYDARLLLIGRTPLPEKHEGVTERLATYRALRGKSAHVRYETVDVCDVAGLRAAVNDACAAWGCELDGIIHQAGLFTERFLTEETRESLTATLRPKVAGTWALHQVLAEHPGAIFIASSSVNGLFGGFGVGAYAAANAFLDGFMQYQRAAGSISSYTIAWSLWDEVGMSRGYTKKDLARSRGYRVLAPRTALQALDIALAHPPGHVVVGLDDGNRHIRRHLDTPRPEAQALRAYFTTRSADVTVEWSPKETLPDAFGTPTRCPGVPVTRLPLTADGDLDQRALREMEQRGVPAAAPSGQPRTDLEKLFASIWREVLGVDAVGIDDNFFDLGGDSVRIAQLGRRLGEVLGRDVALTDLFEYPTISAAVSHLAGSHDRERSVDTDVSGSRGQARRERTRRRPGSARRADDRLDEDSHLPHE